MYTKWNGSVFTNEQDYGCLLPGGKKEFLRHIS